MYINGNHGRYNRLMANAPSIYSRLCSQVLSPKATSLYDGKGFLNTSAIQYVKNLKTGAQNLKAAVDALSRPSAYETAAPASLDPASAQMPGAANAEAGVFIADGEFHFPRRIREFIDRYNDLLTTVSNRTDPSACQLRKSLTALMGAYSAPLDRMGIEVSAQGGLTIDPVKLTKAAKENKIEQFFLENSRASFGFRNRLFQIADEISANPARYLSENKKLSSSAVLNNKYYNILPRTQYAQVFNMGLLFDFWL